MYKTTIQRVVSAALLLGLALGSVGCGESNAPPPDERANRLEEDASFYRHLRLTKMRFMGEPLTDRQLVEQSDLIAVGTIVNVEDGRYVGEGDDAIHTLVAKLQVDSAPVGSADEFVYFETLRGPLSPVDEMQKLIPDDRMMVFLTDVSASPDDNQWNALGAGVPEGAALYRLVRPSGMVIDDPAGVIHPLVHEEEWAFGDHPSLDAAVQAAGALSSTATGEAK